MKNLITLLMTILIGQQMLAQSAQISGRILDGEQALAYANVVLYQASDSTIAKVEVSDDEGNFRLQRIAEGDYNLVLSYVGYQDYRVDGIHLSSDDQKSFGDIQLNAQSQLLETAVVTARRSLVEVKPDRTVFNVEGTVNSAGNDGLELLRKAPGVLVDNNDNISVLGRSGVQIYINGKPSPLVGEELSNFIRTLSSDQIDRIDIITNPGARYEAEGNAGIIDIRLKKSDNEGLNLVLNSTLSQGQLFSQRYGLTSNFKHNKLNVFAQGGYGDANRFMNLNFDSHQNGIALLEKNHMRSDMQNFNVRAGMDYMLNENHTIGFIVDYNSAQRDARSNSRNEISALNNINHIDSILHANSVGDNSSDNATYNINYQFTRNQSLLNIDLDYGQYHLKDLRDQPNRYFAADDKTFLSESNNSINTARDIDIYTAKLDYETSWKKIRLDFGSKYSLVKTDNLFRFYDGLQGEDPVFNDRRSNRFDYSEQVIAFYTNVQHQFNDVWAVSAGLRSETSDVSGDLRPFLPELQEPSVEQKYTNLFPSAGITYTMHPGNTWALQYSRRINRPDYPVLNPFEQQLTELSYEKGNPYLVPELVNNVELGYTMKWRYNFKIGYSHTKNQITRLIGPDKEDPRAGFITWENLATQDIVSANASLPFSITKHWDAYFNVNASWTNNQADYGDEGQVDVQAYNYNIYQQHTFKLPKGFVGELSGHYAGPGVWGSVFLYKPNWGLNIGLQKRFFADRLNVKVSGSDLFYKSGWRGHSDFNGLYSQAMGNWDSRRVSISASYNFGNSKVKARSRRTGIETEAGRVNDSSQQ